VIARPQAVSRPEGLLVTEQNLYKGACASAKSEKNTSSIVKMGDKA
jgi:hypothetical protein